MSIHSAAYSMIKRGELKLLDVILKLDDRNVTESLRNFKPFADQVKEMTSLYVTVNHSISVPCSSKFLDEGKLNIDTACFLIFMPAYVILL